MAIGFDVPDNDIYSPVKYRRTRLPSPIGRKLVDADVNALLLTKFSAWRYESEYRCFCSLGESVKENGLYFEKFSPDLKLAEIIVGDQSTISRSQLADALGDQSSNVTTFKARQAFGTFSVVKNRNPTLWK